MIRILILDDEELICKTLDMMIRRIDGIGQVQTDLFYDGAEALDAVRRSAYDIALTDLRMPGIDGLAFMEAVQNLPEPPRLIVVSAYGDFDYVKGAFKSGAYDYLMKPVNFQELQDVLLKCLKNENKLEDNPDDQAIIEDILHFMEENIEKNISLSDVAAYVSMEYSYFSSYFKRKTGKSFSACLQEMKNKHAQKLLTETELGIEELAMRMGYSSGSNFSRAFRRGTGKWPSEYRRSNKPR